MQRAGEPTFDMVVELERGQVHTWSVIKSVGLAVDCLLKGGKYKVEKRVRLETKSEDAGDGPRKVSRLDYQCGLGGRLGLELRGKRSTVSARGLFLSLVFDA